MAAPRLRGFPHRDCDSPDSGGGFFFARECDAARMADVTIEIIKNGPYIVTGEVEIKDADGNSYPVEKRMALCRCGASSEKPFCDGTHSKIGFQAAEKAVPESAEG